jgi:sugar lactone lactonase YvrE
LLRRITIIAAALGLTGLAAWTLSHIVGPVRATKPERTYAGTEPAAAFPADVTWLNTGGRPLGLSDLRGKVVLLTFWSYGCIACFHVLPDLKRLEGTYGPALAVIGVHSGRHEQERGTPAVRNALARYDLDFPVVNDRGLAFRDAYRAETLPTLVVIDPKGRFVGSVVGDGHYDLLDAVVGGLIEEFDEAGGIDRTPLPLEPERPPPPDSPLRFPGDVLADEAGSRLFIADSNNHRIVVADLEGRIQQVIGGRSPGSEDGDFASAEFRYPQGLALAGPDTLYVADTRNNTIRRVDLAAKRVQTVAGTRSRVLQVEQTGPAGATGLNSPWDVLWHDGLLYIAMAGQHQLWVLDPRERQLRAFAGSRRAELLDGPLLEAGLIQPSGLATDSVRLFVADTGADAIRVTGFDPGSSVATLVGPPPEGPDGVRERSPAVEHPLGVAWLGDRVVVADTYNHRLRVIDPRTGRVRTLVDKDAGLDEPAGLSVAGGRIYVADTNNHRIVSVDPESGAMTPLDLREAVGPDTRGRSRQ